MFDRARIRATLKSSGGVALVFAIALAIRAVYNLAFHPPLEFTNSDMGGYLRRAARVFEKPDEIDPWLTFFPFGTHGFVAIVQRVFGKDDGVAMGLAFALCGAGAVTYAFAFVRRLAPTRTILHWVFAALASLHVPHVMLGSFVLSEAPFSLALMATAFYALRLDDEARWSDALLLGIAASLGLILRPQILLSLLILGAVIAARGFRRSTGGPRPALVDESERRPPRVRLIHVALVAIPLAVTAAYSAHRVHRHIGRYELVSTNGDFNQVFGRCHASKLESAERKGVFELPPFKSLELYESKYGLRPVLPLDPAFEPTLRLDGPVWDEAAAKRLAAQCREKTGTWRQIKYAASHVILLWEYNVPWPTKGFVPSLAGGAMWFWLPGLLVMPFLALARFRSREIFVGAHTLALLVIAIVYFGDTRLRVPYDFFIVWAALSFHAAAFERVKARFAKKDAEPSA